MSKDDAVPEPGSPSSPDAAGEPVSAGVLLRAARQSQGMDIDSLAALLKVPVHKLQALEENRSETLADPVFARALASSMCRVLKLDPAPVLSRLPAIAAFKVTTQNRGINAPFRARESARNTGPSWSSISRPVILVGLALLLGAGVLVFLPSIQQEIAKYRKAGPADTAAGQVVEPGSTTTTVITPTGADNGVAGVPSASPDVVAATPVAAMQGAALPAPPSSAGAEGAVAQPAVSFSAKRTTSIKVTDATGALVLDRALRAGESVSVSGALPLTAVVNRANAVQVQVHGQAFDLAAVTKNNIARFEVK